MSSLEPLELPLHISSVPVVRGWVPFSLATETRMARGLSGLLWGTPKDSVLLADFAGTVKVIDFHPLMKVDRHTLSGATGDQVQLTLDFPNSAAGLDYQVLFSFGNGPLALPSGLRVPLVPGLLLSNSRQGLYPFTSSMTLQGVLPLLDPQEVNPFSAPSHIRSK